MQTPVQRTTIQQTTIQQTNIRQTTIPNTPIQRTRHELMFFLTNVFMFAGLWGLFAFCFVKWQGNLSALFNTPFNVLTLLPAFISGLLLTWFGFKFSASTVLKAVLQLFLIFIILVSFYIFLLK